MIRVSFEDRELLNQALADDIIDIDDVRNKVEMIVNNPGAVSLLSGLRKPQIRF